MMLANMRKMIFFSFILIQSAFAFDRDCCPTFSSPSFCENFSFNAAWLYWKVNGDDFDFAVEKVSDGASDEGFFAGRGEEESFHDIKFDWDSGFRIGFGYDSPRYCWGVALDWTHFDSSSHKDFNTVGSSATAVGIGFPPIDFPIEPALGPGDFARFTGALNFRYDVVDLELGKWLLCGNHCFTFRPHIGLRFANIQEKFKDRVEFTVPSINPLGTQSFTGDFSTKNRFKGVGVRAGLDADLCLCGGLSIIGRSAVSLLWGDTKLKNHMIEHGVLTPDVGPEEQENFNSTIKEHYKHTKVIADLSLGVRYQMMCGCYPFTLEASWEHHYLFSQHRYWVDDELFSAKATTSWKDKGLLALQGLTLSAWLMF